MDVCDVISQLPLLLELPLSALHGYVRPVAVLPGLWVMEEGADVDHFYEVVHLTQFRIYTFEKYINRILPPKLPA